MVDAVSEERRVTGAENVLWDLSIFYAGLDDPAIDADMEKLRGMVDDFAQKYAGKVVSLSPKEMAEAVEALIAIYDLEGRLSSFAGLNYTTDTSDPKRGALQQKLTEFSAQINQKIVFFSLEWNKVPDADAEKLLDDAVIAPYRHYLEAQRRYRPYELSEAEEKILLDKNVTGRQAWTRFFTQVMSSMRYEFHGEMLTQTEILSKMHDENRAVRHRASDNFTEGLRSRIMELTYIFNVLAADKATEDRMRGYPSWISSRNLSNKASDEVVEALIETVTSNYDLVARHYTLKAKLLDLHQLFDYDRYAPLPVKESDKLYTWNTAKDIVLSAFHAFNGRMGDVAEQFFDGNWIHAALLPNKRGGAFASPTVPSAHPYVFVNYDGRVRDVSTLAHELGHGIHMALSAEAQGLLGLYTPLTTAEMASVFAEMLVFSDLMKKEKDPEVRLSMLSSKIEDTFATVFRQISMNRFEHGLHTARRTEGELPTERISEVWMESQHAMFQGSVNLRDEYSIWWSYVPHFLHTPGYVYAYSFGELLVLALFALYQEQGDSFAPKYLDVLAAGDSDYPENILAKVGVDLNDPAFWQKGINEIKSLVEQEEALAKEVYPERFE